MIPPAQKSVALILFDHKTLGPLLIPYVISAANPMSFHLVEPITEACINNYSGLITSEIRQIVKLSEKYTEKTIQSLFAKDKKKTLKFFIDSINEELLVKNIRPYIEKSISKILPIVKNANIDIYSKNTFDKTVALADQIHFSADSCYPFFSFERDEEGITYSLRIKHKGKEIKLFGRKIQFICQSPGYILTEKQLYLIHGLEASKLKPFLVKDSIRIPKRMEEVYFAGFIRDAVRKFETEAKGFAIEEMTSSPQPFLTIEPDLKYRPCLKLVFKYNDIEVEFEDINSCSVSLLAENDNFSFTKIVRDHEAERCFIDQLTDEGMLVGTNGMISFPLDEVSDELYDIEVINWLNYNKNRLLELGFQWIENEFENKYFTGQLSMSMESSEKPDWFDLQILVHFDSFTFPFSRLKKHILNGTRLFKLPNGTEAVIPVEWFSKFRDLLNLGKIGADESIQLAKFHFSLIDQINGLKSYDPGKLLSANNSPITLPAQLNADLRPYQREGFESLCRWNQNGFGGILADEMGLGKTLQTITLILKLREDESNPDAEKIHVNLFEEYSFAKPVLIVMPLSLLNNWEREIRHFAPSLRITNLTEDHLWRSNGLPRFTDIAIISYGTMRNYPDVLSKTEFRAIILDESQNIKNPESKTYRSIMSLKADFRLTLTGTPIENRLTDLWAQFNFINPGLLGSVDYFKKEFAIPIEKYGDSSKQTRLQSLIHPFMIRRTKEMVAKDLPELTIQTLYCTMSEEQRKLYETEKSKIRNWVLDEVTQKGIENSSILILKALHTLRLLSNHPVLMNPDYTGGSGKTDIVSNKILDVVSTGKKVLIFSSYVKHLQLMEEFLKEMEIGYTMLTGSHSSKSRNESVNRFQEDPDTQVFLISLKAGGTGLNLTAADYVFILDPWWNPAAEKQALNRAHRIGQKKNVFVYRFISDQTIEEKIAQLQEKKNELSDAFSGTDNPLKNMNAESLSQLLD